MSSALDFDVSEKDRPVPALDKAADDLMWPVPALGGASSLEAASKPTTIKIIASAGAKVPAPRAELATLPFAPVEFEGLAVKPYVNQQGCMAYTYRATGMRTARPVTLINAKEGGPKDAE